MRHYPNFYEVHNNLADVLLRQGMQEDAARQWQEALRLRPDAVEAHANSAPGVGLHGGYCPFCSCFM